MNIKPIAAAIIAGSLLSVNVYAEPDNNPVYAGASFGTTSYDSGADSTFGFKALVGYDITKLDQLSQLQLPEQVKVSAEVNYTIFGAESNEYYYYSSTVEETYTLSGFGAGAKAGYLVNDKISVYGFSGLELVQASAEVTVNGQTASSASSDSELELYFGFGAQFVYDRFRNQDVALTAEYKSVGDLSYTGLGLSFGY